MRYGILLDMERCTSCRCYIIAYKQCFDTDLAVDYNQGRVVEWGKYPDAHSRYLSTMCNHCDDASYILL